MRDDPLPPLRVTINNHDLRAKKSFGQNFLLDLNLTRKIARLIPDIEKAAVFEVGPGPGGLTRALLTEGAAQVFSVEKDVRCIPALDEIAEAFNGAFSYVVDDALKIDHKSHLDPQLNPHIASNLPYNIGTVLLTRWMASDVWKPWFQSLTLMFQREVAERIVAKPGTKTYGRLAVLCQWRSSASIRMTVPAEAFTPPPKVNSAIIQIIPTDPIVDGLNIKKLEKFTEVAFGQRRKMLRSSLKKLGINGSALLIQEGFDDTVRAEDLSVEDICRLAFAWQKSLDN